VSFLIGYDKDSRVGWVAADLFRFEESPYSRERETGVIRDGATCQTGPQKHTASNGKGEMVV